MPIEFNNIFILTGKTQSGKTNSLLAWIKNQKNAGGILQPVIDGKRFMLDILSDEKRCLEAVDDEKTLTVGKHKFSQKVFEWAKVGLLFAVKKNPDWLIVDEVGKLELNNKGLEPVINYLINDCELTPETKLLFVVRNSLVKQLIERYSITNYKIIHSVNEL